jgi:hypothetical protein
MIETLLEARLITPRENKIYQLFTSDLGRECLITMQEELFWEEPTEDLMNAAVLGFYEGRRSIIRGIKSVIEKVENLIHKQNIASEDEESNPRLY